VAYRYLFRWGTSVGVIPIALMAMKSPNGVVDEVTTAVVAPSEVDGRCGVPPSAALCNRLMYVRVSVGGDEAEPQKWKRRKRWWWSNRGHEA
jgi:hypothetical protein